MAAQLEAYRALIERNLRREVSTEELLRALIASFDRRLTSLEDTRIGWEAARQTLVANILRSTSEVLTPIATDFQRLLDDSQALFSALTAAEIADAHLTGAPTAPTPTFGDASTRISTTAFVAAAISALVNAAPAALDTLKELADALGDDPNFATTVTNALAGKQPLAPNLTTLAALASVANLSALAGLTGAADKLAYFTGAGALALANVTALARTLLGRSAASDMRSDLGLVIDANVAGVETGTWTPVLTCAIPGDLAITYTTQNGRYSRIANLVVADFRIITSSFTHSTASGLISITGFPFGAAGVTGDKAYGAGRWQGITKANYTDVEAQMNGASNAAFLAASGSGQAVALLPITDLPSGGAVELSFTIVYPKV